MKPRVSSQAAEGIFYALTAFGPFAFGAVEPWSRAILEVMAFALALACYARGRRAATFSGNWFWLVAAAFAALGAAQALTPVAPDAPWPAVPFSASPHATRTSTLLWAAYACVLWSAPRVLVTHEAARRYTRFLFVLGLAVAGLGLLQEATGTDKIYWWRRASESRFFAAYYNRDHAANVMLLALAAGVGIFMSRWRRYPAVDGPGRAHMVQQSRVVLGMLTLLLAMGLCGARAAFLAIPLTAALLGLIGASFFAAPAKRRRHAAAALAGGALIVAMAYRLVSMSADAGAMVDASVAARFSIYADAWNWWRDAPLFGTGLGSFETIYPAYQDLELRGIVEHAHSDWLQIALEAGGLGITLALSAAGWAATAAARAWRAARSSEMRALIAGGFAGAVAFAAHVLFEFCFQIPANAVLFAGLVGFVLAAWGWKDKAAPNSAAAPPPDWAQACALALFLAASGLALRPAAAQYLAQAPGEPSARASNLARALAWEDNPLYLKQLAGLFQNESGEGADTDFAALRVALGFSLSAAEQRPFDAGLLLSISRLLARLGRLGDSAALLERAASIRFSPVKPPRRSRALTPEQKIEALRTMGMLPERREPR